MITSALDSAVFDVARVASNDNHYIRLVCDDPEDMPSRKRLRPFRDGDLPVEIPSEKATARLLLSRLKVGGDVSVSQACANANLPLERGWRGEMEEPPAPRTWKPRERNPANSNEPENWPLAEALRRDGRHDDVLLVVRYRSLVTATGTEPIGSSFRFDGVRAGAAGSSVDEMGLGVEMRSKKLDGVGDVDRAHKAGWPSNSVPGGNISYRETRKSVQQLVISTGHRTIAADEDSNSRSQASLHYGHPEDTIIERMDGRAVLAELRRALGGLAFVLEDAVLGHMTLTWIGEHLGYRNKARSAKAKVLVYTAIDRLRDRWRMIDRQMKAESAACERRVKDRREELRAERVRYLGLAA